MTTNSSQPISRHCSNALRFTEPALCTLGAHSGLGTRFPFRFRVDTLGHAISGQQLDYSSSTRLREFTRSEVTSFEIKSSLLGGRSRWLIHPNGSSKQISFAISDSVWITP